MLEGLNVLLNSEQLKCSIFLDGPMIEALYNVAKPLMFGKIQNAIRSGALEFLGGGYYDPMLPLFPEDLQMMQLELHRDYLKKVLGVEPQGYFNSFSATYSQSTRPPERIPMPILRKSNSKRKRPYSSSMC